ncbi:MAG: hypothetical protein FJX65_06810 [Alphaproteobacteria bacterium]|nr:hypothetical protein [Alphaproteobacteria bacterium]
MAPRFVVFCLAGLVVLALVPLPPLSTAQTRSAEPNNIVPAARAIELDVPFVPKGGPGTGVGPVQFLTRARLDLDAGTVTLPLEQGRTASGEPVWFVLTDASEAAAARAQGVNHAAKLANAHGKAVREVTRAADGTWVFGRGRVDFSPERKVEPGEEPKLFPPRAAAPGSVGDADYTPLVRLGSVVYNAPVLAQGPSATELDAFCDGRVDYRRVHDNVLAICPRTRSVTLGLTLGFSVGRPILYFSTEANDPLPAALEGATYAPALKDVPVGAGDRPDSAVERLVLVLNGARERGHPHRQGIESALAERLSPLNVLGGVPTLGDDYSPLWDVFPVEWTREALDQQLRARLTDEATIIGFVDRDWLAGPGGTAFGPAGMIVNCPVVLRVY